MPCTKCTTHACMANGELPDDCTSKMASPNAREQAIAYYNDPACAPIVAAASSTITSSIPGHWPRIREIVHFAREIGAKRIGIASCMTFIPYAELLADILRDAGFEPIDAMCRIGSITRAEAGLASQYPEKAERLTCNPAMQADVLNEAGTDFNIILGLCLGHDMIFAKRSNVWVTTLAIKDQSRSHEETVGVPLRRYRAIERLRQDLYDVALADSIGGCGSQLAAAQGVMGASEEQLMEMAHEAGLSLMRYGL